MRKSRLSFANFLNSPPPACIFQPFVLFPAIICDAALCRSGWWVVWIKWSRLKQWFTSWGERLGGPKEKNKPWLLVSSFSPSPSLSSLPPLLHASAGSKGGNLFSYNYTVKWQIENNEDCICMRLIWDSWPPCADHCPLRDAPMEAKLSLMKIHPKN